MNAKATLGLVLDPLDVLFFRDGRPFGPGSRVGGGLPAPQTLAGAIITALLRRHDCDFQRLKRAVQADEWPDAVVIACGEAQRWIADVRVRGPWFARRSSRGPASDAHQRESNNIESVPAPEVLTPAPATLHGPKKAAAGEIRQLRPLAADALPGWKQSAPYPQLRPLWNRGGEPTQPVSGFLTPAGLGAFLRGETVAPEALIRDDALFGFDQRTGIAIDPDRLTAAESQIYGAQFLSLRRQVQAKPANDEPPHDVVFYAELVVPPDAPPRPLAGISSVAWGGEGRRAALEATTAHAWPKQEFNAGQKPLLVLTTPGLFRDGWQPRALAGRIVSAAVSRYQAVSGWDLARGGPKTNRFAAAAGSVYFLDSLPADLPSTLSDNELDARQGWGAYLLGAWTDDQ